MPTTQQTAPRTLTADEVTIQWRRGDTQITFIVADPVLTMTVTDFVVLMNEYGVYVQGTPAEGEVDGLIRQYAARPVAPFDPNKAASPAALEVRWYAGDTVAEFARRDTGETLLALTTTALRELMARYRVRIWGFEDDPDD